MAHIGLPRAYADSFARDTSCDPLRAFPTTSRYGTETSSRLRIARQAPHAPSNQASSVSELRTTVLLLLPQASFGL